MVQSEQNRARINEALGAAAETLGLGQGGRQKVIDMIETLAREFSYIEALKDHLAVVLALPRSLRVLQGHYRRERAILETLLRVQQLSERPIAELRQSLDLVNAHITEVISALRNLDATVEFIREERDRLREQTMLWEELMPPWRDARMERSERVERLIRSTYRFVVTNFPLEQRWALEA